MSLYTRMVFICYDDSMDEKILPVGKTRYTHYHLAHHLVWIPKYRRKILTARFLREKFPHLKKVCGKEHLWTQSYDIGTAGTVCAEIITRSITECQGK